MLNKRIKFGGEIIDAIIATAPVRIVPERKMTVYSIPGANREVVQMEDAWEPYDQPYTIFIGDGSEDFVQAKVREIASVLFKKGIQRLTDDYEEGYFRLAYFKGPVDFENRFTIAGKGEIVFRCMAERYLESGDYPRNISNNEKLYNPTAYASKPLIKLTGNGNGTITVGDTTVTITGMTDYLYLDCDKQDAYRLPSENRNSLVTGSYPTMPSGNNLITFTGGITAVEITPRWWTL